MAPLASDHISFTPANFPVKRTRDIVRPRQCSEVSCWGLSAPAPGKPRDTVKQGLDLIPYTPSLKPMRSHVAQPLSLHHNFGPTSRPLHMLFLLSGWPGPHSPQGLHFFLRQVYIQMSLQRPLSHPDQSGLILSPSPVRLGFIIRTRWWVHCHPLPSSVMGALRGQGRSTQ